MENIQSQQQTLDGVQASLKKRISSSGYCSFLVGECKYKTNFPDRVELFERYSEYFETLKNKVVRSGQTLEAEGEEKYAEAVCAEKTFFETMFLKSEEFDQVLSLVKETPGCGFAAYLLPKELNNLKAEYGISEDEAEA